MPLRNGLVVIGLAVVLVTACRSSSPAGTVSSDASPVTIVAKPSVTGEPPVLRSFPTQAPIDAHAMAQLIGRLTTVDGCLWVIGEHYMQYPIAWPYGYGWSVEDGVVQLRDETGRVVAHVDDVISMAGGEGSTESLSDPCLTTEKVWYAVGPIEIISAGTPSP